MSLLQNPDTQVIDSRAPEEVRDPSPPQVSGLRQALLEPSRGRTCPFPRSSSATASTDYNRAKLQASMTLALRKRPVTPSSGRRSTPSSRR